MLNAIRFVVFGGGEFKFEALIACRSVHVAPHVVPSVSSADVTVNVINGVAVGVGVGVTFGLSLVLNTGAITATSLIFRGNQHNVERKSVWRGILLHLLSGLNCRMERGYSTFFYAGTSKTFLQDALVEQ